MTVPLCADQINFWPMRYSAKLSRAAAVAVVGDDLPGQPRRAWCVAGSTITL